MSQQTELAAAFARLVTAINVVDAAVDAIQPGAAINDGATSALSVWSSNQTQAQINTAIAALINGAGIDDNTLKELADKIAALAQADAGLVSTAAVQAFNAAQQLQACENLGIGNPAHNFVTAINAGLNAGL